MESGGLTGVWPVDVVLGSAAVLGGLVVIKRRAIDPVRKGMRQTRKLLRDLYGQDPDEAMEGQAPAPGVFTRIETIESRGDQLDKITSDLEAVKWEVETNGHSNSLRNIAVTAAANAIKANRRLDDLSTQMSDHITWSETLSSQNDARVEGLVEAIEQLRSRLPTEDEPDQ